MKRYDKDIHVADGQEIKLPAGSGTISSVCCDCGLTHDIRIIPPKSPDEGVTLIFYRNNRATGQNRRWKKAVSVSGEANRFSP